MTDPEENFRTWFRLRRFDLASLGVFLSVVLILGYVDHSGREELQQDTAAALVAATRRHCEDLELVKKYLRQEAAWTPEREAEAKAFLISIRVDPESPAGMQILQSGERRAATVVGLFREEPCDR